MIDILLYTHSDVRKTKNKTLHNYPLKKFHLNSFMNVVRYCLCFDNYFLWHIDYYKKY